MNEQDTFRFPRPEPRDPNEPDCRPESLFDRMHTLLRQKVEESPYSGFPESMIADAIRSGMPLPESAKWHHRATELLREIQRSNERRVAR